MSPLALFSDELERLVKSAAPSVVALEHRRGHGTGLSLGDGLVLTNAHVTQGQRTMRVRFHDSKETEGRVLGLDRTTDLAVLRVERLGVAALPLAPAGDVSVGQVVLALGHPYGFERSVSLGVVSALERRLPGRDGATLDGLIQTDAAINPGNSGGPLLNARGQVVGINTAMLPFAQGIGFAVPSATASWVSALLVRSGRVQRRFMGIAARNEVLGERKVVRIVDVQTGGPAAQGGLKADDVMVGINGTAVGTIDELQRLMAIDAEPAVDVTVMRAGQSVKATVRPKAKAA
jgi:serine protease Do